MARSPELPPEIILHILHHLDGFVPDLRRIALISRAWCGPAQSILHSSIYIDSNKKVDRLTQKYTDHPHLRAYASFVHLDGYKMSSYSEGMVIFEKTVMADGFESLMASFNEDGGGGIRDLYIESYQEWNEEMSRRISAHFPSVERLEIMRLTSTGDVQRILGKLMAGMHKLSSITLNLLRFDRPSHTVSEQTHTQPPTPPIEKPPIQLAHLTLSPANSAAEVLEFLNGPCFDFSRLRSLKLGWHYSESDSESTREQSDTAFAPLEKFLAAVGPHVTRLTIATPLRNADMERNLNVNDALGDIIAVRLLDRFAALKQLVFCAHVEAAFAGRSSEDYGHLFPVACHHAYSLAKKMERQSTVERVEVRTSPRTDEHSMLGLTNLQDHLLASGKFPYLRGYKVVDENGRREFGFNLDRIRR
ncbi:hypothetical protein V5O48_013321 [Marasmius crinis-equi]|uniref:F-box domain-containing protein n=1 Tax=Marasmius crinis-equi TaxID=585013 RepID=A0ABR3F0E0_9AGAR